MGEVADNFAETIRRDRQQRGLTVKAVCNYVGVTQKALYNWETGRTQPNLDTIALLSKLYGVSIAHFFGEVKEDPYYTSDEIQLINVYRMLTQEGKDLLMRTAQIFAGVYEVMHKEAVSEELVTESSR